MRHRPERQEWLPELTLRLTLDCPAETLGLAGGCRRVTGGDPKKKRRGKTGAAGDLLVTCGDTAAGDGSPGGACLCGISSRRDPAEWEKIAPADYFRYSESLAEGYLRLLRERLRVDLRPHITGAAVETPLTACLLRPEDAPEALLTHARRLFPERQDLRVTEVTESGGVTVLTLQKTDGFTAAWFRPGQHLLLWPQDGTGAAEPFLLCSSPALTREGKYRAASLRTTGPCEEPPAFSVGTEVRASAPLGDFYYTGLRDRPAVAGITDRYGAAAFLAMAAALRDGLEQYRLTVLYCGPEEEAVPFEEEWETLRRECGRIRPVRLTGATPEQALDAAALRQRLPHEACSVFVCGASPLCRAALRALEERNLPLGAVRVCAVDGLPGPAEATAASPDGERI